MKVVSGDLLELAEQGNFDIIVHGCNCFHTMGAGLAAQIAKNYPQVVEADKRTAAGDPSKLGTLQIIAPSISTFLIVNAYTQFKYGTDSLQVEYGAVRSCFTKLRLYAQERRKYGQAARIGYPKIGAGLAGGDWNIISRIIEEELQGLDHTLVEYKK